MAKWLVVRSWMVEADTGVEAIERAEPGKHQDVRAMLRVPSVPAVRLTFSMQGTETAENPGATR